MTFNRNTGVEPRVIFSSRERVTVSLKRTSSEPSKTTTWTAGGVTQGSTVKSTVAATRSHTRVLQEDVIWQPCVLELICWSAWQVLLVASAGVGVGVTEIMGKTLEQLERSIGIDVLGTRTISLPIGGSRVT